MIVNFKDKTPRIGDGCFIAPNATVIGDCYIGSNSSVWFNAVIRGDDNEIIIGENTNIQDGCIIHTAHDNKTMIGDNVTVGHGAIIHGCTIMNNCLIGMGSIILDGAVIEDNVIIGANSLVTTGKRIPRGSLVIGSPAKIVRRLEEKDIEDIRQSSFDYVQLMKHYNKAE